jgi:N-acetyl-gamma-glutamyl-phosphate reductase
MSSNKNNPSAASPSPPGEGQTAAAPAKGNWGEALALATPPLSTGEGQTTTSPAQESWGEASTILPLSTSPSPLERGETKPLLHKTTGVRCCITGAAGYTGGELIALLLNHPQAQLTCIHSHSQAGKPLHAVHGDLLGETNLHFTGELDMNNIDVLFLCVGHGEAKKFLADTAIPATVKIIDLSQDFRLAANANPATRAFTYGLPELNRDAIKSAQNIANPGCFATAIQLGLLPLAKAGLLKNVHTTGITGSTGAGQSLSTTSHFSWRANNIQAYKTLQHQHLAEISESLTQAANRASSTKGEQLRMSFIPWRGDFTRGIFVSSCIDFEGDIETAYRLFEDFYAGHPFTVVSRQPIDLKMAVNTNKCLIQLEYNDGQLVIHSAIDNLLKGASGQAVQNMNLMFGLAETTGLKLKGTRF